MPKFVEGREIYDARLEKPFRLIIGGASGSGKTSLLKNVVDTSHFSSPFDKIVYFYPKSKLGRFEINGLKFQKFFYALVKFNFYLFYINIPEKLFLQSDAAYSCISELGEPLSAKICR